MAWIEIHNYNDGDPMMINTNDIGTFYRNGNFTQISFCGHESHTEAKESYEQVKALIEEAERG